MKDPSQPERPTRLEALIRSDDSEKPDCRLTPRLLYRLHDQVGASLHEPWTVEEMARLCHTSPFYFCRLFKKTTGQTPHQYLLDRRIERAQALLSRRERPMTIAEVAYACGFCDQAHLSRQFKLRVGVTPSQFAREALGRLPDPDEPGDA